MSAANNGGPAFPIADDQMVHRIGAAAIIGITDPAERDRVYIEVTAAVAAGMTLRDYFAGKAMQGYMVGTDRPNAENMAKTAYQVADAMLIERAK